MAPCPHLSRRAQTLQRLLLSLLLSLLGACASLPSRLPAAPSTSISDTADTPLGRLAAASLPPAADGPSGFRLLPTGEYAYGARIGLTRRAARGLDLQLYHLHHDQAGLALLRELRAAADRGVRVRLLVDDFHVADVAPLLHDLAAHAQVQVRLFNPLAMRSGSPLWRLLLSRGDFEQHNHRMHNKLFIADQAVALYGGRNVADEYFMGHPEANFIDMDVLSTGAIVADLAAVFDRYWNSDVAWPIDQMLGPTAPAEMALARFDAAVAAARPRVPDYPQDPLGQSPVEQQLQQGRLLQHGARAQVFADPPDKATSGAPGKQPTAAMQGLMQALAGARKEVVIVSPYFLPGEVGMPMMRRAAEHGVRTLVFTNSLATTDEPLVHLHYSRYRAELLRIGVRLHEVDPGLTRDSGHFGNFGRSTPRLHAKVALVDRRWVLAGSVNLDARSAVANTEMGVVIDSPKLAAQLMGMMGEGEGGGTVGAAGGDTRGSQFRLQLRPDGQGVQWAGRDAQGRPTLTTDEPGSSPWLQFKLWLQSLFIAERLL